MRPLRMRPMVLAGALALGACGGEPEPPPKAPSRPPAPKVTVAQPANPVSKLQAPSQPKEALLAEVRKRQLTNEDFTEGDNNRDPFRSYLSSFAAQAPIVGKQHKIVLQKFALDELKLAAIVQGDGVSPKAMFVDPSGMGVNIVRGDHVSKADATVVRVAPDRVFFEIEEDAGNGRTRKLERVVELHAGEVTSQ